MAKISFEDKLKSIEEIILKLEEDDVSLEASIELYQKGMKLLESCNSHLETVEKSLIVIKE